MKHILLSAIIGLLCSQYAQGQDGVLDPSFGLNGKTKWDAAVSFQQAITTIVQPDEKILVAFRVENGASCVIVRYHPDGSPDLAFGDNGAISTTVSIGDLAVQEDGKILVAGTIGDQNYGYWTVLRYMPHGLPDYSFGMAGYSRIFKSKYWLQVKKLALQQDEKILVAGEAGTSYGPVSYIARFKPNGSLDSTFAFDGLLKADISPVPFMLVQPDDKFILLNSTGMVSYLPNGSLNPDFGDNGIRTFSFNFSYTMAATIMKWDDGKIYTCGYSAPQDSLGFSVITCHLPDGSPDQTFGLNGISLFDTSTAPSSGQANAIGLQRDGKIIIGGTHPTADQGDELYLMRFNQNGTTDSTFGHNGIVTRTFHAPYELAAALKIRRNDQIVLLGQSNFTLVLSQYEPNGQPDATFGTNGWTAIAFESSNSLDAANAVVVQPDGKIITAGTAKGLIGFELWVIKGVVSRCLADGTLDPAFGYKGKAVLPFMGYISSAVLQNDGKIIVGGDLRLVRLLPDGQYDPSWGMEGTVYTGDFTISDYPRALALQPDGKLLVAGTIYQAPDYIVTIARYLPNGFPDLSFGLMGRVTSQWDTSQTATDLAIQPDGKILVAGYLYEPSFSNSYTFLARYMPDGTPDLSFGENGVAAEIGGPESQGAASAIALQHDGKIILGGIDVYSNLTVMRYLDNGHLDPTFGMNGKYTGETSIIKGCSAMVLDRKDRITAVTGANYLSGDNFLVLRLSPNGSLDSTFGDNGVVITDFGTSTDYPACMAIQADSLLVVAGSSNHDVALTRYRIDHSVGIADGSSPFEKARIYPNPAGESTWLDFGLSQAATLTIDLLDASGQYRRAIARARYFEAGRHQIRLQLGQVPPGTYMVRLASATGSVSIRVVH